MAPRKAPPDPGGPLLVLHRPQSAENLGAVARVMKNLGLARLAVVVPPAWAGPPRSGGAGTAQADVLARARRTARKATDLLEAAALHRDLRSALGPSTWVCGTTSRAVEGRPSMDPRALGAEVVRRSAAGQVAVVFGEERRGLSDAELALCHAVCTIPTSQAYDSMNLAQAVAVVAYEIAQAGRASAAGGAAPARGPPARHETMEALWDGVRVLLSAAGFLNPQNPGPILAELRRAVERAEPTQREAELLAGAVRALQRLLDRTRG